MKTVYAKLKQRNYNDRASHTKNDSRGIVTVKNKSYFSRYL